jgi:uncharacterized protein
VKSTLVTDTSVVYAALDSRERDHTRCVELLVSAAVPPTLATPVIVEVGWISSTRGHPDAMDALLRSIDDGSVVVVNLEQNDYRRARELLRTYADLPLDFVDASVVVVAERLGEDTIATLDHRHFSVVRPAHVESFTLVP